MEHEEWRSFKNIEVSNFGNVRSLKHNKIRRPSIVNKYRVISVSFMKEKRSYKISRLICHLFFGMDIEDKKSIVDHIDGNTLNDTTSNLRVVDTRKNAQNQVRHRNGKLCGTHHIKNTDKYSSFIHAFGKCHYLGKFDTEDLAHEKYKAACDAIYSGIEESDFLDLYVIRRKRSKTGEEGITYYSNRPSPYKVNIGFMGKRIYIGSFLTLEEAKFKYTCAKKCKYVYYNGNFEL